VTLASIQAGEGGAVGVVARAGLSVLSVVYGAGVAVRGGAYALGLRPVRRLPVRVVSVGNLVAGGTGKTPFVAWLAARARERGRRVGILSRGYGPRPEGSPLSDEGTCLREALGSDVPQVEDPDRVRGGARLLAAHPDVDLVVLDDGFQHRRLSRDVDVVLLDATDPFGGGRLLPRGRLREGVGALARAHAVVLTRSERVGREALDGIRARVLALAPRALLAVARTAPSALRDASGVDHPLDSLRDAAVYAYAGVGNPRAFVGTLTDLGARVVGTRFAPDHHAPGAAEAAAIAAAAASAGATLVTTTKDWVKLRAHPVVRDVRVLHARAEVVESEDALLALALGPGPG
jgi:tetraacyldisaccharide 4'-kinase